MLVGLFRSQSAGLCPAALCVTLSGAAAEPSELIPAAALHLLTTRLISRQNPSKPTPRAFKHATSNSMLCVRTSDFVDSAPAHRREILAGLLPIALTVRAATIAHPDGRVAPVPSDRAWRHCC